MEAKDASFSVFDLTHWPSALRVNALPSDKGRQFYTQGISDSLNNEQIL